MALGIGVVLALGGLTAGLGLQFARVQVLEKLDGLGERAGVTARTRQVDVLYSGGLKLTDFEFATAPSEPASVRGRASEVTAYLSWTSLFAGQRRPNHIVVDKLRVDVRSTEIDGLIATGRQLVRRLRGNRPPSTDKSKPSQPMPGLTVTESTVLGSIGERKAAVRIDRADLLREEAGTWAASARGRIKIDEQESSYRFGVRWQREPELSYRARLILDPPLRIAVPARDGGAERMVSAEELEVDSTGTVRLRNATANADEAGARVAEIALQFSSWPPLNPIQQLRRMTALGLYARVGENTLESAHIALELETATPDGTSSLARVLRDVRRVEGRQVRIGAKAYSMKAEVADFALHLNGFIANAPSLGVREVDLTEPRLTWVRPNQAATPDWLRRIESALGTAGEPDGPPPELLGDEEDEDASADPPPPTVAPGGPAAPAPPGTIPGLGSSDDIALRLTKALQHSTVRVQRGAATLLTSTGEHWLGVRAVDMRAGRNGDDQSVFVDAAAHLSEQGDRTAAVQASVKLESDGTLRELTLGSSGSRLARMLPDLSPYLRSGGSSDVSLDVRIARHDLASWRTTASVTAKDIGFDWWRVAQTPVDGISVDVDLDGVYSIGEDRWLGSVEKFRVGRTDFRADIDVGNLSGVPTLKATLEMPDQPCAVVADSIPTGLIPRLQGIRAHGKLGFKMTLDIDLAKPKKMKLDLDGDLDRCRISSLGPNVDLDKLASRHFTHRPTVEGEEITAVVGPGTRWWTPLDRIPESVAWAAVATEDLDFFVHNGFKLSLIKRAIKLDLDRKRYVYGGSTISQQLVKNLFLSREKTLSRKIEEAIITWQMEHRVSKNRILELYLNCIEFGPNIYGVRMASLHYFGKEPGELTPLEGAFLAGNKPCPKCGYRQWKKGGVDKRWHGRMRHIMKRLHKRGWITDEEFANESHFLPNFYYAGAGHVDPTEIRPRKANWRP